MQKTALLDDLKKAVIWREWKNGVPMITIARAIKKPPATVYSYLQYHGGIQPGQRKRAPQSLSLEDREEISRGLTTGRSLRSIADFLRRSPYTVIREINKNGGPKRYRVTVADKSVWKRARRPKPCLLARNLRLKGLIAAKLTDGWSPEKFLGG
jgi:transposase, IS30 family